MEVGKQTVPQHAAGRLARPRLSYALCASEHAGAQELCALLAATGLAGSPGAFFERVADARALEAALPALLGEHTGANGVFGFALRWSECERAFAALDAGAWFPGLRVVRLVRRDRVRQAIESLWHERRSAAGDADGAALRARLERIEDEEWRWEAALTQAGVTPVRLVQEELPESRPERARAVLTALGIEIPSGWSLTAAPPAPADGPDAELVRAWRAALGKTDSGGSAPAPAPKRGLLGFLFGGPLGGAAKAPSAPPAEKTYGYRCVAHTVPAALVAGNRIGARVTLANTSSFPWRSSQPEREAVLIRGEMALVIRLDGEWVGTQKFPRAEVWPGQEVTIHFALEAPAEPGAHAVSLDLIEWEVAHFKDRGVAPVVVPVRVEGGGLSRSAACFQTASRVNPWFLAPTRGIQGVRGANGEYPYPLFLERAKGCRVWDLEGKEYVDYMMANGSALLGHADERVLRAIAKAMELSGPLMQLPSALEIEVARMLTEDIPCAEMVTFGKNGSDACTVAARLARAHTGKRHILFRGYHGWQDFWAEQPGWADGAIPARPEPLMHVFPYNDRAEFFRLYERHKHDLAAVMIEPSPWGGDRVGIEMDDHDFLRTLQKAAHDAGALLIFDEVFSGYRVPQGTVQRSSGVVPDLACAGKAIASGMPLAAAVGRADIMRPMMPRIFYPGPTFRGEVYSLAAAKATLEIYRQIDVPGHVHDYGTALKAGVERLARELGIAAGCVGPPYRMLLRFDEPDPDRFRLMRTLFVQEILKRGVTSFLGILIPSYAHDEAALAKTLEVFGAALETVAEAVRKDELERRIEIPPVYFG